MFFLKCTKLCFGQNNKKMGQFSYFVYLKKKFSMDFKIWEISKPIFPDYLVMLILFSEFDKLMTTKNTNSTFFRVGGSIKYVTSQGGGKKCLIFIISLIIQITS